MIKTDRVIVFASNLFSSITERGPAAIIFSVPLSLEWMTARLTEDLSKLVPSIQHTCVRVCAGRVLIGVATRRSGRSPRLGDDMRLRFETAEKMGWQRSALLTAGGIANGRHSGS